MSLSYCPAMLLAQAEQAVESSTSQLINVAWVSAILIGVLVLPFVVGHYLGKYLRMQDHGWKIGLILCTIASGFATVSLGQIKKGIDLQGGVILIYEIDEEATAAQDGDEDEGAPADAEAIPMSSLVQALSMRINPSGTKEIVIRPYGPNQVEIIIPEVDPVEIERIKNVIVTAGYLEFRIVANQRQHEDLIALAKDPKNQRATFIVNDQGEQVAVWAQVARETKEQNGVFPLKVQGVWEFASLRDAKTFEPIELSRNDLDRIRQGALRFEDFLVQNRIEEIDVLMAANDGFDIKGSDLSSVRTGYEGVSPCVDFTVKSGRDALFGAFTGSNLPDTQTGSYSMLGIILDGKLLSAPRIISRIDKQGQITGQFTREEVQFLVDVLQAGGLPATLRKEPISENQISPLLGQDTVKKGQTAIVISLVAVLLFVVVYYRFSGVVACAALLANLLFTVAIMVLLKAAFTLPGLAGLVLTVGMSVDANVLIFERIREELARGSALRMAIRNGFARATTTIVDANVTTLITAIVLYAIGTDQVRGFAVTLILGILMSMYTAIFCARVVFDIAERKRWITDLKMSQIFGSTRFDFVGIQKPAMAISVLLIVIGLGAVAARGQRIFDIDFTGGSSVQLRLKESLGYTEVNERLRNAFGAITDENGSSVDYSLTSMSVADDAGNEIKEQIYKVDSSLHDIDRVKEVLRGAFSDNGNSLLMSYSMQFEESAVRPKQVAARDDSPLTEPLTTEPSTTQPSTTEPSTTEPAGGKPADETPADEKPASETPQADSPPAAAAPPTDDAPPAQPGSAQPEKAPADASDGQAAAAPESGASVVFVSAPAPQDEPATDAANESPARGATPANDARPGSENAGDSAANNQPNADDQSSAASTTEDEARTLAEISFKENPINAETLQEELEHAATAVGVDVSDIVLSAKGWDGKSSERFDAWTLEITANVEETKRILHHLEERFAAMPVWPSSSVIGGKVAGNTQGMALAALFASLLGIVAYIWVRFQKVVFGLAAVAALVHDVLITLGAIAASYWLAGALGFLLIEEFKISLSVVAAFLTIIGYSLNDTIVVFDRIREVRGKSPHLTGEMVNVSLNQTLSRTTLTSLTTLIVVVILYAIGGQGIHGFAFALMVGIVVGTYSSIFVASPILLWMTSSQAPGSAKGKSAAASMQKAG